MLLDNADLQTNVPSSAYFCLSHVRSLPQICVTNLSNCEIWLQIKPNTDFSLTLDAGESESMLEIRKDFLTFVVKLNLINIMQIAEV